MAYVLHKDYGYGFRGPNDRIWGLWEADRSTNQICKTLGNLIEEYGSRLDIIYDEDLGPGNTYEYSKLFFRGSHENVYTVVAVASVAVVSACIFVYFQKRKL
jgi:hypothetical protein